MQWMKCNEILPEPGKRVIAANDVFVGEAYLMDNGQWCRHHGMPWDYLAEVSHWMPLPEAPV